MQRYSHFHRFRPPAPHRPISAEAALVDNLRRQQGAGRACAVALLGARSERGEALPYLPSPIRDQIAAKLDEPGAVALTQVWVQRLPPPVRRSVVDRAARAYGLTLRPGPEGWQRHLEALAQGLALSRSERPGKRDEVVLAALLLGTLSPVEAVMRSFDNRNIFDYAVTLDGMALTFACPAFQACPALVERVLQNNPRALQYAAPSMQGDRALVMPALRADGLLLKHVSDPLRRDPELVSCAVNQNGMALQHAHWTLKCRREVVTAAVKQNGMAIAHAHWTLRDDPTVALAAVQQNGLALRHVDTTCRAPEVALCAIRQNYRALEYAYRLRDDRETVLGVVQQDGLMLQYAGPVLKRDPALVLCAVTQNREAAQYAAVDVDPDAMRPPALHSSVPAKPSF